MNKWDIEVILRRTANGFNSIEEGANQILALFPGSAEDKLVERLVHHQKELLKAMRDDDNEVDPDLMVSVAVLSASEACYWAGFEFDPEKERDLIQSSMTELHELFELIEIADFESQKMPEELEPKFRIRAAATVKFIRELKSA